MAKRTVRKCLINPLRHFETDTDTSLLTATKSLKSSGRTLVISGINRAQFKVLIDCGITQAIEMENFVPDLEFGSECERQNVNARVKKKRAQRLRRG